MERRFVGIDRCFDRNLLKKNKKLIKLKKTEVKLSRLTATYSFISAIEAITLAITNQIYVNTLAIATFELIRRTEIINQVHTCGARLIQ
jgi:hypothetical protein